MKKIISLFKRNYEGDRLVYDEVVPGAEWVIAGEGVATVKMDGTCCMIRDGRLHKRYDRKLTKANARRLKQGSKNYIPGIDDYKPAPEGWEAAEPEPNHHTGHWPGWLPVSPDAPEDKWHREALESDLMYLFTDGTYELCGPKVQGNPYHYRRHHLFRHGIKTFTANPPRTFVGLKQFLSEHDVEGIVWHHPDGRMVKIKRRDFGLDWPVVEVNR